MTDRELMQQALYYMDDGCGKYSDDYRKLIEALRARLSQCDRCGEVNPAEIHTCTPRVFTNVDDLIADLEKPEPVAWVAYENGEKHGIDFDEDEIAELPVGTMLYPIPPNFLDPAKVARLIDEAFERGKKEIDMEQVKDIAQKLADCAVLNSAPPQREWQGLTVEEIEAAGKESRKSNLLLPYSFARAIEAKLKEKNNA